MCHMSKCCGSIKSHCRVGVEPQEAVKEFERLPDGGGGGGGGGSKSIAVPSQRCGR